MWDVPAGALEQAARLAGPGATVRGVRALAGGTGARTSLIQTANPQLEVVLREFPPGDDAAGREARALRALDGLGGLAPRLLASDVADRAASGSWLLISRLPGSADITPRQPTAQVGQLGRVLARIHQTPVDGLAELPEAHSGLDTDSRPGGSLPRAFDRLGGSRAGLSGPAAGIVAASWDIVARAPEVLVHYDFWSGNVVWTGEALSGVVDWTGGCLGPPGFDTGWCRLDLYLLHGQATADRFLAAYEEASASILSDPLLWDLWAVARSHEMVETWVPNYRDLDRADLTAAELRSHHTAWTEHLLGKVTGTVLLLARADRCAGQRVLSKSRFSPGNLARPRGYACPEATLPLRLMPGRPCEAQYQAG
jgi:aminoglycoside phosphotransferase (APT) family kinase protein